MLVVDASCLYEVVADGTKGEVARARMRSDPELAAPHLVDAEVLGVIRRDLMLGRIDPTTAHQAVEDLRDWPGERFDHHLLMTRAWELRDRIRTWDAFYVALAEALDATLLTFDQRLARAVDSHCHVEVPGDY